jgi:O-antigen ligase
MTMTVPLVAPAESGLYLLQWDLIQEGVVWFSDKNGILTASTVRVKNLESESDAFISPADELAARQSLAAALTTSPSFSPPIPDRRTLWRIAARQFAGRPLLGIGLDNFRLTYGRVAGLSDWNNTIHTNNWYLENLVSLGALGSLPFFVWLVLLGFDIVTKVRKASRARPYIMWQIALGTALVAYLIHGLLDYFLLFNATAMLFWILIGLWIVKRKSGNE